MYQKEIMYKQDEIVICALFVNIALRLDYGGLGLIW